VAARQRLLAQRSGRQARALQRRVASARRRVLVPALATGLHAPRAAHRANVLLANAASGLRRQSARRAARALATRRDVQTASVASAPPVPSPVPATVRIGHRVVQTASAPVANARRADLTVNEIEATGRRAPRARTMQNGRTAAPAARTKPGVRFRPAPPALLMPAHAANGLRVANAMNRATEVKPRDRSSRRIAAHPAQDAIRTARRAAPKAVVKVTIVRRFRKSVLRPSAARAESARSRSR
jgi:hypothetical protein